MEIFYFSLAAGSQRKTARILQYPNILINFMTATNSPPPYEVERLFIDSGGFHSSMQSGRYTKTDKEYLQYIETVEPSYFALRDYPCEPELLRKHGRTVSDHINMTVKNHIRLLDLIPEYNIEALGAIPVPVIQGWEPADYLQCIDAFQDHGLISSYMAIGSVCRRTSIYTIRKVITTVRDALNPKIKLHGFGVKLTALKELAVWNSLYSVDSGAWDYLARWRKWHGEETNIPDASLNAARGYLKKIDVINCNHSNQTTLS